MESCYVCRFGQIESARSTLPYLTPNKIDINGAGIQPDYEVEVNAEPLNDGLGPWFRYDPGKQTKEPRRPNDGKDIQLAKAMDVLKANFDSRPAASSPIIHYARIERTCHNYLFLARTKVSEFFRGLLRKIVEFSNIA